MILSADRMSGDAIRSGSDITMALQNEDESSNNQDERDEHLERKRRAFHDDDGDDEKESAYAVVVGGGVPGTRSRVFCGGVLYSKRLVSDSTSRERKAGKQIGSNEKERDTSVYLLLLFGCCVAFVACCLLLALVAS